MLVLFLYGATLELFSLPTSVASENEAVTFALRDTPVFSGIGALPTTVGAVVSPLPPAAVDIVAEQELETFVMLTWLELLS